MVEILEGFHTVKQSPANGWDLEGYIIECEEGLVLVDTGFTSKDIEAYEDELIEMGRCWGDIKDVLITHGHGDHIENLSRIKELTGAEVFAGIGDVVSIEERTCVRVDKGLRHGDQLEFCGGIEAILVPGHSKGNMCFFFHRNGTMIVGDTIFGDEKGNIFPPPKKYCDDVKMAAREISRLLDYDFDKLLLSHGKNLMTCAKEKVQELCKRMS